MLSNSTINSSPQPSEEALEELQRVRSHLQTEAGTRLLWTRVLSEVERRKLGTNFEDALEHHGGAASIWRVVYGGSPTSATIHAANAMGFLTGTSLQWLLREFQVPQSVEKNLGDTAKPEWNRDSGKLFFQGKLVRRVRVHSATNVCLILDAFQEDNWPDRIDDPLRQSCDGQSLREAIRTLNKNIELIRFLADGTGEGVLWEALDCSRAPHMQLP